MDRRDFFRHGTMTTVGLGAGLTILNHSASVYGNPANNKVNLGIIGCGGRGTQLTGDFVKRDDVNILYCCDAILPNAERAAKLVKESELSQSPKLTQDIRVVLDDPEVDAVVCATPDHWHALGCVWACQAGKDVYTEKPASHSAWEGQKMVEAARKYKRVVQLGIQNRSAPYNFAAKKYIDEGKLGKVHFCRIYNMKQLWDFKMAPSEEPPQTINWDLWLGPAAQRNYSPTYPGCWHFLWDFSSGDMITLSAAK